MSGTHATAECRGSRRRWRGVWRFGEGYILPQPSRARSPGGRRRCRRLIRSLARAFRFPVTGRAWLTTGRRATHPASGFACWISPGGSQFREQRVAFVPSFLPMDNGSHISRTGWEGSRKFR